MKITYLGHAAVKVEVANKIIYIDPFLSGNPKAPITADEITSADIVIVTHDHGDHLGDAFAIAKRTNAWLVSQYEITVLASENGIEKIEPMNIGGPISVEGIKIALTPAWHTSNRGDPTGVIIQAMGKTLYHAGDTGLFSDMKLIGELYKPDIALLPIGGRFTMDIYQAAKAVEFIRPKYVIPIHYNTFDLIKADPEEFKKLVKDISSVIILNPGETFNY
ncbi:MAG: metal-dependent hydrolase [candidate division WOR-3 bacterium]|jgi:L-ascorbate metabolism protein UlaG (beta-lactamase superfamily)